MKSKHRSKPTAKSDPQRTVEQAFQTSCNDWKSMAIPLLSANFRESVGPSPAPSDFNHSNKLSCVLPPTLSLPRVSTSPSALSHLLQGVRQLMIRLYSAGVRFLDQQVLPHGRRVRLLEGQLVTCPRGLVTCAVSMLRNPTLQEASRTSH